MDAALEPTQKRLAIRGINLAVREWPGLKRPFLLVHGLASNARMWDLVAQRLNREGHPVVAVDQRGHGQSDKPEDGFDFDEVTADLKELIGAIGLERPIVAGQSWGGNVVLDLAARYPNLVAGVVLVDGGFIDLQSRPEGGDWERISVELQPPDLTGTPRKQMEERMRSFRPDWPEETLEMRLANFETLADGTVRPWLSKERHMKVLRGLWEHRPADVYPRVKAPVLVAVADHGDSEHRMRQHDQVSPAERHLPRVNVRWFFDTAHDIHVHRPLELSEYMLWALATDFFES